MGAYTKPLTPIKDIMKYFRKGNDGSLTFIGKTLELRIPLKFKTYGALEQNGDSVITIGVMDMIFDDTYRAGLNILASITIEPDEISTMAYKGIDYLVLKLNEGSKFAQFTRVIQDNHVVYVLWSEFVTAGNLPYWFDYPATLALFANARSLTGSGIGVSRSVFEGIIAHIARDKDDLQKPYRLTSMKKPMELIALKSVSLAPTGTVARLNGSYMTSDGLTSALRYQVDEQQPFENILRGLSNVPPEDRSHAIP